MIRKYSVKQEAVELTGNVARVIRNERNHRKCPPKNFVETHKFQGFGENETGNIPLDFIINGGTEIVLFEDFTENHNKTYFQISNLPLNDGMTIGFDIVVRTTVDSSDEPKTVTIPFRGTRTFQYENVRRVTVELRDLPVLAQQRVRFYLEKTFCISCSEGGHGDVM